MKNVYPQTVKLPLTTIEPTFELPKTSKPPLIVIEFPTIFPLAMSCDTVVDPAVRFPLKVTSPKACRVPLIVRFGRVVLPKTVIPLSVVCPTTLSVPQTVRSFTLVVEFSTVTGPHRLVAPKTVKGPDVVSDGIESVC